MMMSRSIFNSLSSILIAIWSFAVVNVNVVPVCLAREQTFRREKPSNLTLQNQYIIQFEDTPSGLASKQYLEEATREANIVRIIPTRNILVATFSSEEAAVNWKTQTRGIKYFEKDSIAYIDRISSRLRRQVIQQDQETTYHYGFAYVRAEEVSDDNASSMKVCVVDSGYDLSHPDLPSDTTTPLITGESFVPGYDWSTDENSHGTHVTGIIAALGENSAGVKGIIRNGRLKLHISKVFDASGSSSWSSILAGFESCLINGANVINLSLSGNTPYQSFQDAIEDSYLNHGSLIFASSGNSPQNGGSTTTEENNYPASYKYVTSVASINSDYSPSTFSTYNDKVDISAPGSSIQSTVPGGGYAYYSGTSMACSHAAGVAALVWSSFPMLPHSSLIHILETTAMRYLPLDDGKEEYYDIQYGHGLINAKKAYDAASCSMRHSKNSCYKERTATCTWLEEWKVCSADSLKRKDLSSVK